MSGSVLVQFNSILIGDGGAVWAVTSGHRVLGRLYIFRLFFLAGLFGLVCTS